MMEFEPIFVKFNKYVSNYDFNNYNIKSKWEHSYRVCEISGKIAEMLKLSGEEIFLAKLIGLLHDIGRFEQLKITNSLSDLKFEHAEYGNKILFDNYVIKEFIDNDKYNNIIYNAIKYHNKLSVPKELDTKTTMFCQILRDADKIDIYRVLVDKKELTFNQKIKEKIISDFKLMKSINHRFVSNNTEKTILRLAFVFDINYKESFILLSKSNYLQKYINSLEISKNNIETLRELINIMNRYISDKVKK